MMNNEANKIKTAKVQYWKNGIMLTAQMTREQAQKLVEAGEAFVITDQAIGAIVDGKRTA